MKWQIELSIPAEYKSHNEDYFKLIKKSILEEITSKKALKCKNFEVKYASYVEAAKVGQQSDQK